MVKVKPLQLFPVHKIPKGTEGWKQKMCWSCLVKPVWLLPWMANCEKVGCSFGGKVHSTDALAVQGCQGPSRWKTLEKGLHFRTCIITADCGVWAGAHRSVQLQHVQFPMLIGWVSVYWPADCQQVSSKGETYKARLSAPLPPPAARLVMFGSPLIASFVVLCLLLVTLCFWNHPATRWICLAFWLHHLLSIIIL